MLNYSPVIKEISSPDVGKLYLCRLTMGEEIKFRESLGDEIWSSSPEEFFNGYLQFALRRDIAKTASSSNGPYLSRADVTKFTTEEKESIASSIIEDSHYLFRERLTSTEDKKTSFKYGEIIHPQNDQESSIEYFQRLKKVEADQQIETIKKVQNSFNFSDKLNKKMLNMFSNLKSPIFDLQSHLQKGGLHPNLEERAIKLPVLKDYKLEVLNEILDQQQIQASRFNSALTTLAEMLNEQKGATNWNKAALIVTATLALASLIVSSLATYSTFIDSTSTNTAIDRLQSSIGAMERSDSEGMTKETSVLRELRESNELKKELINILKKQSEGVTPNRAVPIQLDSP